MTATTPGPLASRTRSGPFRGLPPEAAILSAVSFTVALGYGIVAPAIPAFARQFGVSVAAAASVISAFALMRVVGALPAGRLVDRFGSRAVMAAGISVVAVSSVLAGFSRSFIELLVLRGVGGLGSAMFSVSAQALLLASVPSELRGRASGLYSGGFLLGGISGPALGGIVAAWSLRAPFFLYGGLLLVPAGIAAFGLRSGSRARGDRPATPGRGAGGFAALAGALRSRAYRAAAAANLADGFAVLGVRGAIIPLFVRDSLHRSATWTGIGFLLFAALNGAALLPAGRIADTLGRRPVIVTGCAISAAGMVMLAVLPGLWAFLGALAVAGFGSGLLDVAPSAMIGDLLDGSGGGIMVAFYQMAGDIGSVTGPIAAGFLVDSASYPAAFALAAAVLGAAALLGLVSPETRKTSLLRPPKPPPRARPRPRDCDCDCDCDYARTRDCDRDLLSHSSTSLYATRVPHHAALGRPGDPAGGPPDRRTPWRRHPRWQGLRALRLQPGQSAHRRHFDHRRDRHQSAGAGRGPGLRSGDAAVLQL